MQQLSPIGLGTGRLASLGSRATSKEAFILLNNAIDHGIRVVDTADTYGSGDSERTIGNALRSRPRSDFFVITKAGLPRVALPAAFSPLNQIGKKLLLLSSPKRDFSKAYLIRSVEASLKRLRMDYVDAFLLHAARAGEPTIESWEALEIIRSRGLSRLTGVSSSDPELVRQGIATGQVLLVETPVSASARNAAEICALCSAHRVTVVGNEVLKPKHMTPEQEAKWNVLRARHGLGVTPTIHLLIAYALAQPAVGSAVIGSSSINHLLDNLKSLSFTDRLGLFEEMKDFFQ